MIVWGGSGSGNSGEDSGGRYNPLTNNWTMMPYNGGTAGELGPLGRFNQLALWTGTEMIVWGGSSTSTGGTFFNTGGRYNPQTNTWTIMSSTNAPAGCAFGSAVWTGSELIVWGGTGSSGDVATGARYDPVTDTWTALSTTNAPLSRHGHAAIWDGKNMVVWGGQRLNSAINTGGRYDPVSNTWTALSTADAPAGRLDFTTVAAGADMLIFGGRTGSGSTLVYYKDTFLESFSHLVYIYQHP